LRLVKAFMRGVGAFLVSMLIFLVLLEVTLQVYTRVAIYYDVEMARYANEIKMPADNPKVGHYHEPNASAYLMGTDFKTSSHGWRDKEYDYERNDAYRVVVLGDSLTVGWGVESFEMFEYLLEERFNEARPVEMINTGNGNYNTEQQANVYFDKGREYSPDKVVMFYFINDAEVTPKQSEYQWLANSRAITFFWSRLRGLLSSPEQAQTFEGFYSALYADDQPGWLASQVAFIELRDVLQAEGVEFQVVMIPELHNVQDYPFNAIYEKVYGFLQDQGIDTLDLRGSFSAYTDDPVTLWVALDDAHPSALAHRMIADYSYDFIAKGIVDSVESNDSPEVDAATETQAALSEAAADEGE